MIGMLLVIGMILFSPVQSEDGGTLTIKIEDIKDQKGQIGVSIYDRSKGWPDKWKQAYRSELVPIESVPTEIEIEGLPAGTYAVSVVHDENKSGDLDKNFMSIPKEGYGVSNNIEPGMFGPPSFDDAKFRLTDRDTVIVISMQY